MTDFDQGDMLDRLGRQYERGDGVPQSDVEALNWYRQAAAFGNVHARHSLGVFHESGRGTDASPEAAAGW